MNSNMNAFLLLVLTALVASKSTRADDVPYDGQSLHLTPDYLLNHQDFLEGRHPGHHHHGHHHHHNHHPEGEEGQLDKYNEEEGEEEPRKYDPHFEHEQNVFEHSPDHPHTHHRHHHHHHPGHHHHHNHYPEAQLDKYNYHPHSHHGHEHSPDHPHSHHGHEHSPDHPHSHHRHEHSPDQPHSHHRHEHSPDQPHTNHPHSHHHHSGHHRHDDFHYEQEELPFEAGDTYSNNREDHRNFDFYYGHANEQFQNMPVHDETGFHNKAANNIDREEQPYQRVHSNKLHIPKQTSTLASTADSEPYTPPPTDHQQNAWLDSFSMFAIWSLDNLFWLIPFVAHSKYNALYFFFTYQAAVLFSCSFGTSYDLSFADAHTMTIIFGAASAAFCWLLVLLFSMRHQQRQALEGLIELGTIISVDDNEDYYDAKKQEDLDLEAPLLDKPDDTLDSVVPVPTPSAYLTIGMTLLAAADDLFFVPVMQQQPNTTFTQVFVGSLVTVFLWSCLAVLVSSRFRAGLAGIPLFMVLCTFASVLTGRCAWDFFHYMENQVHLEQIDYLSVFEWLQ